ncbi:MAG: hypothetical protein JNK82_21960 [Myxococcaceae bacterium]|nr:hypothetical protein [Myxococcaceae bacterium]
MKITLEKNGSVTVKFEGTLSVRQALGVSKVVTLFPRRTKMLLDFTDVQFESEGASALVIPSIASAHNPRVEVIGLEERRAERHLRLVA